MAAELTALDPAIETKINELVNARVNEALKEQFASLTASRASGEPEETKSRKRLALVASKGSLDMAYPPLILATSAAAMDWEVGVFFTFYGLDILNRNKVGSLQVAPLGNPAMPAPIGNIAVPNLIGAIPGMTSIATYMMRGWMNRAKVPAVTELLDVAKESGVNLFACTTTMGVMRVKEEEIVEGVQFAGAAAFLDYASDANVSLFI
jgi:peroxiredoxin family protein